MTEEQKQELMAQLEGGSPAPSPAAAPAPVTPVLAQNSAPKPTVAAPAAMSQTSEPSLAERNAIAAEVAAAVPGATQQDIDEAVKAYQMQNAAAGISSGAPAQ